MSTDPARLEPHLSPSRPSTARLAELVHHAARATLEHEGGALVVYVDHDDPAEELSLGLWRIPASAAHPADPLVGFLAPPSWDVLGLATTGRIRHLDDPSAPPQRAITTALVARHGPGASVIEAEGGEPLVLDVAPMGWVADVLARTLGQPTPPPDGTPAIMFELSWLDQLAAGILDRPSRVRNWRWMADRHPLRGTGSVPAPEELAARTAAEGETRSWRQLLDLADGLELSAATASPPGGLPTTAAEWFDEGTLSRWLTRTMVPPEQILPDLLSILPAHLGESLLAALVEVEVDLGEAA